jgi:hypothetical protein
MTRRDFLTASVGLLVGYGLAHRGTSRTSHSDTLPRTRADDPTPFRHTQLDVIGLPSREQMLVYMSRAGARGSFADVVCARAFDYDRIEDDDYLLGHIARCYANTQFTAWLTAYPDEARAGLQRRVLSADLITQMERASESWR